VPAVVFYNKGGQAESLTAAPGMTVRELLRNHGIPANAVLTWINGKVVAEQAAVVAPDDHV